MSASLSADVDCPASMSMPKAPRRSSAARDGDGSICRKRVAESVEIADAVADSIGIAEAFGLARREGQVLRDFAAFRVCGETQLAERLAFEIALENDEEGTLRWRSAAKC